MLIGNVESLENALKRNVGCRGGGDTKIACFSLSFTNMEFNWHFRWGGKNSIKEIERFVIGFYCVRTGGKILSNLDDENEKEKEFNFPRLFWQIYSVEIKELRVFPFFASGRRNWQKNKRAGSQEI